MSQLYVKHLPRFRRKHSGLNNIDDGERVESDPVVIVPRKAEGRITL